MPRYKLLIEYDGTPFAGWQIQANGPTVQGTLTAAVAAFCGEQVHVQGAGRTDAGVHALGQVAHVDLTREFDPDTVRDALNAHLRPHPIAVLSAEIVARGFRCALFGQTTPLSLSHRQPPRRPRDRSPARVAHPASARRRCDARRRATTCWSARLHHVPGRRVPGEVTGQDIGCARRGTCRRRHPRARAGAVIPAPSGALDGRFAGARR